jgi:RING finger protein 113A
MIYFRLLSRGDYKTGWQLEREYDEAQKKKQLEKMEPKERKNNNKDDSDDDKGEYYIGSESDDDGLPFVCLKCKDSFVNPVVTRYASLFFFCVCFLN